jgi:16S rRNA A1518/A1519 N6-dimethyltransferase RsmA/KsgA/DIM1 with predicted DNA glycosylase/AP lyase activity
MGLSALRVENSLKEAGLSLSIRPEKLTLENFVKLYKILGLSKSI